MRSERFRRAHAHAQVHARAAMAAVAAATSLLSSLTHRHHPTALPAPLPVRPSTLPSLSTAFENQTPGGGGDGDASAFYKR